MTAGASPAARRPGTITRAVPQEPPMLAKLSAFALAGIDAVPVEVGVDAAGRVDAAAFLDAASAHGVAVANLGRGQTFVSAWCGSQRVNRRGSLETRRSFISTTASALEVMAL